MTREDKYLEKYQMIKNHKVETSFDALWRKFISLFGDESVRAGAEPHYVGFRNIRRIPTFELWYDTENDHFIVYATKEMIPMVKEFGGNIEKAVLSNYAKEKRPYVLVIDTGSVLETVKIG